MSVQREAIPGSGAIAVLGKEPETDELVARESRDGVCRGDEREGGWSQKSGTSGRFYCRETKLVRGMLAAGDADTLKNAVNTESTRDLIQWLSVASA